MLDIRTLYFTVACICLCLGVLFLIRTVIRRREAWVLWCGTSSLLLGAGFAANSIFPWASSSTTIIGANALMIAGFLTSVLSGLALAGRQTSVGIWVCLLFVASITAVSFGGTEANYVARVGLLSLVFAICEFSVAYLGLHIAKTEHLKAAWALSLLFTATGFVYFARSCFVFSGAFTAHNASQIYLAVFAVLVVSLRPVAMLLVASERRHKNWERLALHDPLTGALNRAGLSEMIERRKMTSGNADLALCVLLIDVDRFKDVNDTAGHDAGDALLRLVTEVIQSEVRKTDLVVRQGGDEFLVLLREAHLKAAFLVAERIRVRFQKAAKLRHDDIQPTLSIGMAMAQNGPIDMSKLISQADEALYSSKRAGRNIVSQHALAA